jgi:hypothetical protein
MTGVLGDPLAGCRLDFSQDVLSQIDKTVFELFQSREDLHFFRILETGVWEIEELVYLEMIEDILQT